MANKKFIYILFTCIFLQTGFSQDMVTSSSITKDLVKFKDIEDTLAGWKLKGITGVNFGQAALVNWVSGGENSISINAYLNGSLDYRKAKWSWDNNLILEYGMIYSEENNWRKNADKISFSSKIGYEINDKWFYAFLINFYSQFSKGYSYPNTDNYISSFLSPGYSDLALGFNFKPNEKYTIFLSPITARMTIVADDSLSHIGSFGLDPGKKFRIEPGAYILGTTEQKLMENVNIISKIEFFTPYNEDIGNIDINWEILMSFQINKLLTTTLNTTLRYFDKEHYFDSENNDKGARLQFKETLGIGVSYNF